MYNNCQYEEVPINNESEVKQNETVQWKIFLKQLLVCSGVWTAVFVYGLSVGAPTVFIPQIRKEANNTDIITNDMASWLTSAYAFSGVPFVIIFSIVTRFIGRKIPYIVAVLDTFACSFFLYFSTSITHILISAIMQGVFSAAQMIMGIIIVTEYTSPKYRGIFLTLKSATFYWGIWASNAIGTFFHWKTIPLFGMACSLYAVVTIFIWPESPLWLASKGKFDECAASHRWLKGCDVESEKELETLINTQKEHFASCRNIKLSSRDRIADFFKTIKSIEFYKPVLLSIMTVTFGILSGKLMFALYAIDIIKKITNSESTAYTAMLILDGITVLSMYGGCVISKYIKRRTLMLVSGSIGVLFLFTLSLYLYLIRLCVITENKYVSIFLLVAFSIAVSCGPLIMSTSVYGELIPIRSRNLAVCVIALVGKLEVSVSLKIAPLVFRTYGLHIAFLSFGISSSINLILLYKYLPETKDKTLQEISESIKGVKSKNTEGTTNLVNKNV